MVRKLSETDIMNDVTRAEILWEKCRDVTYRPVELVCFYESSKGVLPPKQSHQKVGHHPQTRWRISAP